MIKILIHNISFLLEIHGFFDSSNQAYGRTIYARSIHEFGNVTVRLICAKSKVALLENITLFRLELCEFVDDEST